MSKVVSLHPKGTPERTLESAKGHFQDVLIMGYDMDGNLQAYSSNGISRVADINFMVDVFKDMLLGGGFVTEERNDGGED